MPDLNLISPGKPPGFGLYLLRSQFLELVEEMIETRIELLAPVDFVVFQFKFDSGDDSKAAQGSQIRSEILILPLNDFKMTERIHKGQFDN